MKILIVDDDPDIIEQTRLLLQARGFSVVTADSGKAGFEKFEKEKPDAVILDLIMEEMDSGFMLTYKIKKTEHGKKIPVILATSATTVTGYKFDAVSSEETEWLKCDAILNKPVVVDDMIARIDAFYERLQA